MTYDHLTSKQISILDRELFEIMCEDMMSAIKANDTEYLYDRLLDYIDRMDTKTKLDALSSDNDICCQLLGFDPETGQEIT